MNGQWLTFFFGGGLWTFWYGALFTVFLSLIGTIYYLWQDPQGPSGAAFILYILYFYAFAVVVVITTVDVAWWARTVGYGFMATGGLVILAWIILGLSWKFIFMASDPNYPERLLPGRILFTLHSVLLYLGNLWLLWRIRPA